MVVSTDVPSFTHLHVHSAYSLGEGLSTPAEICAYAQLSGYKSLALTDTNGTYGFMEFHEEAQKLGIKPIYGAVLYHNELLGQDSGIFHLTSIALSKEGLRNLCTLATTSQSRLQEQSALSLDDLKYHSGGLIILIGARGSEVANCLMADRREDAAGILSALRAEFQGRLFVEVQDDDGDKDKLLAGKLLELAGKLDIPPVLTSAVHYVGREKHEIFKLLSEVSLPHPNQDFFVKEQSRRAWGMKTQQEMHGMYRMYREAYENTALIDSMVNADLLDDATSPEKDDTLNKLLRVYDEPAKNLCDKAWRRFHLYFHYLDRLEARRLKAVLQAELDLIISEGLAEVFLLFHEVTSAFRQQGVREGPATGLSVQSLCAYLLNITSFNPYADNEDFKPVLGGSSTHNKILEIQIASEDRGIVARTLNSLFGSKHLAYLPAVEHLTPVRALRAAAKRLDIDEEELAEVIKLAVQHPGISLVKLCEESKQLASLFKRSERVRELIRSAAMLEGLPTGFIKAKRSLVVSPTPLREFLSVFSDQTGDTFVQATKDAFPVGNIFRIDLTPLGSLSVCMRTERQLRKNKSRVCSWDELPRDDKKVWEAIQGGEAMGIYMLESNRIQEQCSEFSPQSIEDLTDFIALLKFRPDAKTFKERLDAYQSQALPDYEYKPELMPVLAGHHGMILYEEQLRDILTALTGMGTDGAYNMLQNCRNEDPGVLSTLRKDFMRRAANENVPMQEAQKWFEKILYYSPRTLSQQRVLADALIVYKMFFLKIHYPTNFFLSLLNTYWDNEAKVRMYLAYLHERRMFLAIDINKSELYFTLEEGKIRLGLHMVEGIDYPILLKIINARSRRRRFKSLEDFLRKTKGKGVSLEDTAKLIMAGAFDFTGISRTNLINALPELYDDPGAVSSKALKDQFEFAFSYGKTMQPMPNGSDLLDKLLKEKTAANRDTDLGKDYYVISALEEFYSLKTATFAEIAGQVSNIQKLKTAGGRMLGFFVVFDFSAFVHVFIPWDKFGQFESQIEEGKKVIVRGRVSMRDDKKVCEALSVKAFSAREADNGENPDKPAERNP
jgi:DNA polymerase-3 subunit alpha